MGNTTQKKGDFLSEYKREAMEDNHKGRVKSNQDDTSS